MALSDSDHAVTLLASVNQHRKWMNTYGFKISQETNDRAVQYLHRAVNYQRHNPLY